MFMRVANALNIDLETGLRTRMRDKREFADEEASCKRSADTENDLAYTHLSLLLTNKLALFT
jgi:hypothetical protein